MTIIPNVGLFLGIFLLILGIANKNKKTIIWGIFGIIFNPLFWLVIIFTMENSSQYYKSKNETTVYTLNEIVKDLDYYKLKNKTVPDSLGQLQQQNKFFLMI